MRPYYAGLALAWVDTRAGAAPLIQEVSLMSDYDRYANTRYGAGLARSGVAVDQGLRAYMIGVYNYMTLGLGVTGLVACVSV